MGKKTSFLSLFPPSFLIFALGNLWGSPAVAVFGLALNVIINAAVLFAVSLVVLFLTGNAKFLSAKKVFLLSLLTTLATDLYSFFASQFLLYDPSYPHLPPFSYYLTPNFYNLITQIIVPGVIALVVANILFKRYPLKRNFLVCFLITIINLPWPTAYSYIIHQNIHDSFERSQTVSQSTVDQLTSKISNIFQNDHIVPDPKSNFMSLRIEALLTVPETGKYIFQPQLYDVAKPPANYDQPAIDYFINGVDDVTAIVEGVNLTKGENKMTFDIPYVRASDGKINVGFVGQKVSGPYGPYAFNFTIRGLKTSQGTIAVSFVSSTYTTKQYNQRDWYK